ncbi:MAG: nitrous oxide reductase accessory protein NosL [Proteobacteria bacterium]|nr:nitrous oxide reductase accessory protein NosL [Pseudomonadota bacterium]
MLKRSLFVIILISLTWAMVLWGEEKNPPQPGPRDKCPVCGMFVAKYPDFVARIDFKDGSFAFFDGAKDMFKYYFNLSKYNPKARRTDIGSIYVTDYYGLSYIDGLKAYYVQGSDVYGPMGRELIPFEKEGEAKGFIKDHKGKTLLRFQEISDSIIIGLN